MLPCPNCKNVIEQQADICWFGGARLQAEHGEAAVYCCKDCFRMATRFYNRAATELKTLLDMLKESTRIALATGRMNFPEVEIPKKDLLEAILQLKDVNDAHRGRSGDGDSPDQPSPQRGGSEAVRTPGPRGGDAP